ncbi:MAG: carboxypeptidase-like regulatory domain-containing protein [Candidatus Zixiibacteriota bacterium]
MRTPTRFVLVCISALLLSPVLLLTNCSDKSSGPGDGGGDQPIAKVTGFVYQETAARLSAHASANGVIVIDSAGHAPEGYDPVAGATIRVRDINGDQIKTATTDAAGHFALDSLPPGLIELDVRAPGSPSADTVVAVTAIAGATIEVGATHSVTRGEATQIGLSGLPCQAMLLATMQPLPPGVQVFPFFESALSPDARTTAGYEWLLVVDSLAGGVFEHPVQYIFVDAASGAVTRVNAMSMPSLNGASLWTSDLDYVAYEGIDLSDPSDPDLEAEGAALSPEVVRFEECNSAPEPQSARSPVVPPGILEDVRTAAPEDIFTLNVMGGNRSDFFADFNNMQDFFDGIAPAQNRGLVAFPVHPSTTATEDYFGPFNALKEGIADRIVEGGKPLLIVHIAAHGGGGNVYSEHSDGKMFTLTPEWLQLETTQACKFRLIASTCYAGSFVQGVKERFEALPITQRADFVGYGSSNEDETSVAKILVQSVISLGLIKTGSIFNNEVIPRLSIQNDDLAGLRQPNGQLIAELEVLTAGLGFHAQHPVLVLLTGNPTRCAAPLGPLVSITSPPISYTHIDNVLECRDSMGNVLIANTDTSRISWGWSKNTDYYDLSTDHGELAPDETVSVGVYYTCESETSFGLSLSIGGQRINGTRSGTASTFISVTLDPGTRSQDFTLNPPAPLAGQTVRIWHPLPSFAEIDSSKLVIASTGEPIPQMPWPSCTGTTFTKAYEGTNPEDTTQYGVRLEVSNVSFDGCAGTPITGRYTIWYSRRP